jgi:hypothetical protein
MEKSFGNNLPVSFNKYLMNATATSKGFLYVVVAAILGILAFLIIGLSDTLPFLPFRSLIFMK